jgi:hypothetical protein
MYLGWGSGVLTKALTAVSRVLFLPLSVFISVMVLDTSSGWENG